MKKLFLYLFLTFLFIAGIGLYFRKSGLNFPAPPTPKLHEIKSEISIDFGDGNIVKSSTIQGQTVFDLLNKLVEENKIEIKTKQYDFGILIESIGGKPNTKDKAWIYFVNSESAQVAADKYLLKAGDKVEWRYIKPTF
jgi:hypothetical protein